MSNETERAALERYLEDHQLKHTKQREAILDVFLGITGHISSDELFQRVKSRHPHIGFTTVYRTMKIFCEAGLAVERAFEDGVTRYEVPHEHHDHLDHAGALPVPAVRTHPHRRGEPEPLSA